LKEETMTPIPGPEAAEVTPPPEAEQVVGLAREDLAETLGLSPEEIRLVSVEAVEWSDASLGCPQPGMMYAQVITPGFRVTLEAGGETYEYHTDTGDHVVLCENGASPSSPAAETGRERLAPAEPPEDVQAVVREATEDLVGRIGLASEKIQLVSVEPVQWSDASLGCPQPGMMYAQMITPGYRVVLEAEGQQYTYHTDTVRFAVLCEDESEASGAAGGAAPPGETTIPEPQDPFLGEMVTKAREDLADRLSVETDQINLLEVREVTWPDASLGCPQPGMVYAQVPQDGLLIRLGVDKDMYFYHSGGTEDPFLCEGTSQVVPKVTPKADEFVPPPDSEIDSTG
jgi:hypothetical protein